MLTLNEIREAYPLPPGWEWWSHGDLFASVPSSGRPHLWAVARNARDASVGAWREDPAYAALVIATGVAHLFRWYLDPSRERCGTCRARRYHNSGLWCAWWRSPNHGESVEPDDWCAEYRQR